MNYGDRIRALSNEELADLMHNTTSYREDDGEIYLSMVFMDGEECCVHDSWGGIKEFLDREWRGKP